MVVLLGAKDQKTINIMEHGKQAVTMRCFHSRKREKYLRPFPYLTLPSHTQELHWAVQAHAETS